MWPIGDLEVAPSAPSRSPPSGSPNKQKSPKKKKTYNVNRKTAKLNRHGSLTSVTSMTSVTSVVSEKDNGQGPGSEYASNHSTLDLSTQSIRKPVVKADENNSICHDFDLQPDQKVRWRSFDIIEGVVSFETDFENTLNQMECESKQNRQRKAKKRVRRNRLRKKFTYTFLKPKNYKPLIDDPDAFEEIRAIEEEFERRREEYAPLLQFNNRKFWKKLSKTSDLQSRVQGVAESLAEMTVGPIRPSQPIRLKPKGKRRLLV